MSRRPLIAGNWKMHKTPQEAQDFIERFLSFSCDGFDCDVLVIPPFTSLDRAGKCLLESSVFLGAQDMHPAASGAYTGAISANMLKSCQCSFVLAGHSERRHVFGDTNVVVNEKLQAALSNDLRPILCVGETLEEREADRTESVLEEQLAGGLKDVSELDLAHVVIAYEPVWAIGTGKTATTEQAQDTIAFIRAWIETRYSETASEAMRILYGGSVNPANAKSLQAQPDIDGALIGGASLDPDSFAQIIAEAMSLQGDDDPC
ncbi:MAG: triose-phosphate isomerase [Candidatus Atribacteria bacterium]|nr:MAG: triose-phosphate isomerase [Candidatus Atribacteria bacterium]